MQVVIEAFAKAPHQAVQFLFPGVPEGRMANVVSQCERFGQVFVDPDHAGDSPRNLRNFDGVSEAVAEVIRYSRREHLRLVLKPSKSPRVHDTVTIALKGIAIGMRQLRVAAASRVSQREPQM